MPRLASRLRDIGLGPAMYCVWAVLAIGLSIAMAGLTAESITRLMVIGLLLGQLVLRSWLVKALPTLAPKSRFILMGTALAAVVEGFHMISVPVLPALRVHPGTPLGDGLRYYGIDLLLTVPAYLVIFSVIWYFIDRYRYTFWQYTLAMGLAQALGDGGVFFFATAPAMLFFLPYPMMNYHAINVIPFLAVRDRLPADRAATPAAYLVIPGLITTYLVCGALIKIVAKWCGLAEP